MLEWVKSRRPAESNGRRATGWSRQNPMSDGQRAGYGRIQRATGNGLVLAESNERRATGWSLLKERCVIVINFILGIWLIFQGDLALWYVVGMRRGKQLLLPIPIPITTSEWLARLVVHWHQIKWFPVLNFIPWMKISRILFTFHPITN